MEEKKYSKFVLNFFSKLGCKVKKEDNTYIITDVPRVFCDFVGKVYPYKICFESEKDDCELVFPGSKIGRAITRFLDNSGKTTLLKINFDINAEEIISKSLIFRNCTLEKITKTQKNSFFSRFSFLTNFKYINEREQLLSEIYIHNNEVINGDLSGYEVLEGNVSNANLDFLKNDFKIAKTDLDSKLVNSIEKIKKQIDEILNLELKRIEEHYDTQLNELSNDLNLRLKRLNELELEMRSNNGAIKEELKTKIERLKKGLLKVADDDAKEIILKEKEFALSDCKGKYALEVQNKLLNTTVIYYPVFALNLSLKGQKGPKLFELVYDPLTKSFPNIKCDSCKKNIHEILLCGNGHIVCSDCISECGDCNLYFCKACVTSNCSICTKKLCRSCLRLCSNCSKRVCRDHLRVDQVCGEQRCIQCLRSCSRCHGLSQEKFFGISSDGSKVCLRCLGEEKRNKALNHVFFD